MKTLKSIIFIAALISVVSADGFIIVPPMYVMPLSVKYHKVTCDIVNGVATTVINQEFVNSNETQVIGARYIFPVPTGVTISEFAMLIDDISYEATVMSKDEARTFFRNAVKNSTMSSLLEYAGNSAYTLEIGNIAPGKS